MNTIIGRLTRDAEVKEVKDGRKVVNFTIAKNERIKAKGKELKEIVKYFDCSYWISTAVAPYMKKGTLVEVFGDINANAWINKDGEAKAGLTMHVNNIELHGAAKQSNAAAIVNVVDETNPADDLPF